MQAPKQFMAVPVITLPNVVFFPETVLPMTVQDNLCKQIIQDCLSNNSLIIISKSRDESEGASFKPYALPSDVCTAGQIQLINDDQEQGVLRIAVKGVCRVKLSHLVQNIPYPVYAVKPLPDEAKEQVFDGAHVYELRHLISKWLDVYVSDSLEREKFQNYLSDTEKLTNNISMLMVKDPMVKQILLENMALSDRISLLKSLFRDQELLEEDQTVVEAIKDYEHIELKSLIPN
ncbi:MAG: LON peptidase substrate-binding domain-containing protein [Bacteriovoracaceae bacterium]